MAMGIFNRKYERNSFDFDDSMLSAPETAVSQPQSNPSPAAQAPKRRSGYNIEDAIKLMRDLPKDQRQMVVSIVQKTLSSANINVTEIIDDAARKLSRLDSRSKQLGQEIEELEAGIVQRRNEIQAISQDTKETMVVKSSFEEVLGKNSQAHRADPVPAAPEKHAVQAEMPQASASPSRGNGNSKKPPAAPIAS